MFMMKLMGKVTEGVSRGENLIENYYLRLINIVGYEPFKGTLNVRLEKPVDISLYATKAVDHILMDGTRKVYAYLAPVSLAASGNTVDCWAIRQPENVHEKDIIELMAKENLKEKLSLHNGDDVEVTFFEPQQKKSVPGRNIFRKLYGVQNQLTKS